MNDRSNKLVGEVISRTTMGVVGLALLFGGFKCLSVAHSIWKEYEQPALYNQRDIDRDNRSAAGLPAMIGLVLVPLGSFFAFAAVVPVSVLIRWFKPPPATLHGGTEADEADSVTGTIRFFNWW